MKFIVRSSIVVFWVLLIFLVLYLPSWKILPIEEKSINLFTWGDVVEPNVLAEFEKETGIKVHMSYFSSNEELQVKLKATRGSGYDLIMPSDYTVPILAKDGLLKPIDKTKLNFLNRMNPALLGHTYDPKNFYAIPFEWDVFGLAVDQTYFKNHFFIPSWRMIYDPTVIEYKVAMNNDPIEAILYAGLYLFGNTDFSSEAAFQQIRTLLLQQKKWVESYTDSRADYFVATGNCPIALCFSALIKRIHPQFPSIDFIIPTEGSFISVENFCISAQSTKEKHIYTLLNYLYSDDSVRRHYENLGFLPAMKIDDLNLQPYEEEILNLTREEFNRFHFFKNIYPQSKVRNLWVEVKSF